MTWYFIALTVWALGLLIRWTVDGSMIAYALEAIAEDEDAAGAAGVNVTVEKLKVTALSAAMTAAAGGMYCQYQMFISPDTVSGIGVSLQMVFAAVVGGIYVLPGPTVGAIITIVLAESLRIFFGTGALGWDSLVYGTLLVVFIVFMPQGLVGVAWNRLTGRR
jgi:branched-chain amino acid transport system permease protein